MTLPALVIRCAATVVQQPPLDPSGEEARRLLRRELTDPEYYDRNIVERLLTWIGRTVDRAVGAAGEVAPLIYFAAILAVVVLAAGVIVLASRVRRTAQTRVERARPALGDEVTDAATLRHRARAALAAGDARSAVIDAFRALAVDQIERGVIVDRPQATAHELALAIGATLSSDRVLATRVVDAADLFDLVLYGDHAASPDQARQVLDLGDLLAGQRVGR